MIIEVLQRRGIQYVKIDDMIDFLLDDYEKHKYIIEALRELKNN